MNDYTNELLNINSNIKNILNNVKNDNDLQTNKNNINLEPFINNNELNENIKTYKIVIKNNLCVKECIHEWVNDLIDIDPDRSQYICYCCKCELTK
jgi:hypothetical protein